MVSEAVQVMRGAGGRGVAGDRAGSSVTLSSLTVNGPDRVTLPVLVTT